LTLKKDHADAAVGVNSARFTASGSGVTVSDPVVCFCFQQLGVNCV
jgi:hypothetical protein